MLTLFSRKSGLWLAILLLGSVCAGAAGPQRQGTKSDQAQITVQVPARELVRQVVDNELAAGNDDVHFMYKDRRQTGDGSKTKMMVETADGTVAYMLAVNDKPLDPQQRAAEEDRIRKLLSNPEEQQKKKKDQQQDSARIERMFRELPKAFEYEYDGVAKGPNGRELLRLKFSPDPNYVPGNRESSVFKAMEGVMLVDPSAKRMARIEADLFKEVSFGWGILGHLDRGGHFIIEQSDIGSNHWVPTYMNIQFTGKALLFKSINLRQVETTSDFVRVPDKLTLAQGVDLLKKRAEGELAQNASQGK